MREVLEHVKHVKPARKASVQQWDMSDIMVKEFDLLIVAQGAPDVMRTQTVRLCGELLSCTPEGYTEALINTLKLCLSYIRLVDSMRNGVF